VDADRVTSVALVRMGQTTGTGCRIPAAPQVPPGGSVVARRGTCWEVDVHRWPAPALVATDNGGLVRWPRG
jgi:hypothetical protein